MNCRYCKSKNTRVTVTETHGDETWRYCRCLDCKQRFKTIEVYAKKKPGPKLNSKTGPKAPGSRNGNAVLTEQNVKELRLKAMRGARCEELAKEYGLNKTTVSRIVHRKSWTHI